MMNNCNIETYQNVALKFLHMITSRKSTHPAELQATGAIKIIGTS
jgi:hypothetical protein